MKIQLKKLLAFGMLGLVIALSSCDGGEEEEDIDPRDKFLGSWNVEETENNENPTIYSANVDYATNSAYIEIYNINMLGPDISVEALVTGNSLTISNEPIDELGFTINGNGRYVSGDKFTLTYTRIGTADSVNINSTYTK